MRNFIITKDTIYNPATRATNSFLHCSDCTDLTFEGKKKFKTNFKSIEDLKEFVYTSDWYQSGGAVKFTISE